MICEHQQTSVLCDKCAILALVKQNAALKEHLATAQTLLDSAHNFQYLKACEQARDKAEQENATLRARIADATSPEGVERARKAYEIMFDIHQGYQGSPEYEKSHGLYKRCLYAAIATALGDEVKS